MPFGLLNGEETPSGSASSRRPYFPKGSCSKPPCLARASSPAKEGRTFAGTETGTETRFSFATPRGRRPCPARSLAPFKKSESVCLVRSFVLRLATLGPWAGKAAPEVNRELEEGSGVVSTIPSWSAFERTLPESAATKGPHRSHRSGTSFPATTDCPPPQASRAVAFSLHQTPSKALASAFSARSLRRLGLRPLRLQLVRMPRPGWIPPSKLIEMSRHLEKRPGYRRITLLVLALVGVDVPTFPPRKPN